MHKMLRELEFNELKSNHLTGKDGEIDDAITNTSLV